jgi:hypothetical protein
MATPVARCYVPKMLTKSWYLLRTVLIDADLGVLGARPDRDVFLSRRHAIAHPSAGVFVV